MADQTTIDAATVLARAIASGAQALRAGSLVAFPTETVYGLGADATNGRAVAAIFAAKGRPGFNPLIIHVASLDAARALGDFNPTAMALARAFWPGPLTLVVPRRPECPVSDLATAGLDSIAIRVPAHHLARALLKAADLPIAAPSANRSGHVSPTRAAHVAADLGDKVSVLIDGGACPIGMESTIVDVIGAQAKFLRPGGVSRDQIAGVTKLSAGEAGEDATFEVGNVTAPVAAPLAPAPLAPGQLASHYAPRAQLRLNVQRARKGEALLGFGPIADADMPQRSSTAPMINLSENGDLIEAAANLFSALRELDATGAASIAVMPIPSDGIGEAINDRLHRAAAPRPK